MTTCPALGGRSHDGIDPQLMYLHHGLWPLPNAVLCLGCRTRLIDSGWDWRPERRTSIPAIVLLVIVAYLVGLAHDVIPLWLAALLMGVLAGIVADRLRERIR